MIPLMITKRLLIVEWVSLELVRLERLSTIQHFSAKKKKKKKKKERCDVHVISMGVCDALCLPLTAIPSHLYAYGNSQSYSLEDGESDECVSFTSIEFNESKMRVSS
jgi:hypothetical protein